MAKQRHDEPQQDSSRNTLIMMVVGALLVAGLVGWALTRTVDTSSSVMSQASSEPPATNTVASTAGTDTFGFSPAAPANTTAATSAPLTALPAPGPIGDKSTVTRIAPEDLRDEMKAGAVTVIDVRPAEAYAAAHIPGSLNIPLASVEAQLDIIPKGKPIVAYCT